MYNFNRYVVSYVTGIGAIKKPTPSYQLLIEKEGIKFSYPLSRSVLIKWVDIEAIASESQGDIKKSASLGKAALGLFFLGPVGALLGASMKSTHDNRVMYVQIKYKDEYGETCECILQTKQAFEISNTLNTARKKYYVENNIPLNAPTKNESEIDQLTKLAELKDKGIISADEFETKKKQILSL